EDWEPYYPSEHVISFEQYLALKTPSGQRVRVVNLCCDYSYLSQGYYCSLLSEARGHHVIPPSRVLTDVSSPLLYQLNLSEVYSALDKMFRKQDTPEQVTIKSYFGQVSEPSFKPLARFLFERFPCPILAVTLRHSNGHWAIGHLQL